MWHKSRKQSKVRCVPIREHGYNGIVTLSEHQRNVCCDFLVVHLSTCIQEMPLRAQELSELLLI